MPFLCAQERDWWRSNNGGDSNWPGRACQDKTLRGWDLLSVFSPACLDLTFSYSISAVIRPLTSFNVTVSTPSRSTLLKVTESPSSSTRLKSQNSDFASRLKRQQGVQDHKRLHFAPTLESGRIKGGTLPHRCCMIGRRGGRLVQAASVTTAGAGTKKGSSDSL